MRVLGWSLAAFAAGGALAVSFPVVFALVLAVGVGVAIGMSLMTS